MLVSRPAVLMAVPSHCHRPAKAKVLPHATESLLQPVLLAMTVVLLVVTLRALSSFVELHLFEGPSRYTGLQHTFRWIQ
jgi:hypothetical protein